MFKDNFWMNTAARGMLWNARGKVYSICAGFNVSNWSTHGTAYPNNNPIRVPEHYLFNNTSTFVMDSMNLDSAFRNENFAFFKRNLHDQHLVTPIQRDLEKLQCTQCNMTILELNLVQLKFVKVSLNGSLEFAVSGGGGSYIFPKEIPSHCTSQ